MFKLKLLILIFCCSSQLFGQTDSIVTREYYQDDSIAIDIYTIKNYYGIKEVSMNCIQLFDYENFKKIKLKYHVLLTDSLGMFKNIETLHLYCDKDINFILPDTLSGLIFLKNLYLDFNFTDSLFSSNLILNNVEQIRISGLKISKFPEVLNQWKTLSIIRLSYSINNSKSFRIFLKGISKNIYLKRIVFLNSWEYDEYNKSQKRKVRRDLRWAKRLLKNTSIELTTDLKL